MTDQDHMEAATDTIFLHESATTHGSFFLAGDRLEVVCSDCGIVLYEGPTFEDPVEEWEAFRAMPGRDH